MEEKVSCLFPSRNPVFVTSKGRVLPGPEDEPDKKCRKSISGLLFHAVHYKTTVGSMPKDTAIDTA
jgi:hypothetical protein